jgi:predicted nuclease of predicted toxin-antitoxin system
MIKLLTDENIPPAFVEFLRNKGFDVKDIRELEIHGVSDSLILNLARQDKRV